MTWTPVDHAAVDRPEVSRAAFGYPVIDNLNDLDTRTTTVDSRTTNGTTGNAALGTRMTAVESGKVAATRTVTAGTGLTGGGDLSANRTLAVSFGSTSTTVASGDRVATLEAAGVLANVSVTANSAGSTGTTRHIWTNSAGLTIVNGAWYRVSFDTGYDTNTAPTVGSTAIFELAYVSGGSATLSGSTSFWRRGVRAANGGSFLNANGLATFQSTVSGTYTFMGVLSNTDAGVITKTNGGTALGSGTNYGTFTVERIA